MTYFSIKILIILIIPSIIFLINHLFSIINFKNREKISPFECGFDPLSENHLPFSINFYLIALIFLIFDIEIILIVPIISTLIKFYNLTTFYTFISIIWILLLTLWLEWYINFLKWY